MVAGKSHCENNWELESLFVSSDTTRGSIPSVPGDVEGNEDENSCEEWRHGDGLVLV